MDSMTGLIPRPEIPTSEKFAPLVPLAGRPASQHPAVVYITRLGPGSRRAMKEALERIARILTSGREDILTLNWAALRYPHVQAVRAVLAERYAPATANRHLSALRGCLQECRRLGQMPADAYATAIDVEPVRGSTLLAGRSLSQAELRALLDACRRDPRAQGRRDAALIAIAYAGGLRRSELAALTLEAYTPGTGELKVVGKGRKERCVYITGNGQAAIQAWLEARGSTPGRLFLAINKGGRILDRPLCGQAVERILRYLSSSPTNGPQQGNKVTSQVPQGLARDFDEVTAPPK
jgi:integrase/recombinase XerD